MDIEYALRNMPTEVRKKKLLTGITKQVISATQRWRSRFLNALMTVPYGN